MILFGPLLMLIPLAVGQAADISVLVEQALDETVDIELTDVTVPAAVETLADRTGVDVRISPPVLALLPYGPETTLSATLKGMTLREGLDRMLAHLGMRFMVVGRGVDVVPTEGLARLGRRASWNELDTLAWLRESRWSESPERLVNLRPRIQFQVDTSDPWKDLQTAIQRVGAGPGDDVLSLACESLDWSWYPSGNEVVVLSKIAELERRLNRRVDMKHKGRPLWEVMLDLGEQAQVPITAQAGAIASLPLAIQDRFTLLVEGRTAAEVLEVIASTAGLGYRVQNQGVVFYLPSPGGTTSISSTTENPYRVKVRIPSSSGDFEFDVLIREGDLSPESLRLLNERIRRAAEALEAELKSDANGGG